ncbi:hypothetical protein Droror1_Dr00000566 [Drosera rotundifolia]
MRRSSIANLKENLSKIAHDVHGDDDDYDGAYGLQINGLPNGHASAAAAVSDRRMSNGFACYSNLGNGGVSIEGSFDSEVEQYKTEIRRLKDSEAEIKALSINYAALLKEKEDLIARLNQENGSLRQNLETANGSLSLSRNDTSGSTISHNMQKASNDISPNRQLKVAAQSRNRSAGNQLYNGVASKPEGYSNEFAHSIQSDVESNHSVNHQKDLADLVEEKNGSTADLKASYELQMKQLRMELQNEQDKSVSVKLILQEKEKLQQSLQEDLNSLKLEHDRTVVETSKLHSQLNDKGLQIRRLQMELERNEDEDVDGTEGLKSVIASSEEDKRKLQHGDSFEGSAAKEELEKSLRLFEKDLKEAHRQRDKALQELARLKQHLLDKESEESEKMDEDSKIIEELRQTVEHQKLTIAKLEISLQQAYASREEVNSANASELQKSKELIEDLREKLGGCMRVIDAKNIELSNLQTALGQYYAEIEAKDCLEVDLSAAREECAKLSQLLKVSNDQVEEMKREQEDILSKHAQLERVLAEAKNRVNKLEEDNGKLRRVLEQSMTRLNRMSVDSDFLVDRRIVIKLLVTYFQRNHSKEVLDLMVRMLGFSDEDKHRIGGAQQGAGKGVVRGVLGFPGRLVGGILSGSSAEAQANSASENQSFADLWVDFLLKETEERGKRESMEAAGGSHGDQQAKSPTSLPPPVPTLDPPSPPVYRTNDLVRPGSFLSVSRPPPNPTRSSYSYSGVQQHEQSSSEFSTVPLTPSESSSWSSKQIPKY